MQPAQPSLFQLDHLPPPQVRQMLPNLPEPDVAAAVQVLASLIAKAIVDTGGQDGDE
jgi:hypothetical protein